MLCYIMLCCSIVLLVYHYSIIYTTICIYIYTHIYYALYIYIHTYIFTYDVLRARLHVLHGEEGLHAGAELDLITITMMKMMMKMMMMMMISCIHMCIYIYI